MQILKRAGAIFDRTLDVLGWSAGVLLNIAMLLICTDVCLRYFLTRPLVWSTEICEYLLLGITSLGIAWLLKEEGHVKVELVLSWLTPRAQALTNAITSILGAITFSIIVAFGAQRVSDLVQWKAQTTKVLFIPKAPLVAFLLAGCLLLAIQFVRRSYKYMSDWRSLK